MMSRVGRMDGHREPLTRRTVMFRSFRTLLSALRDSVSPLQDKYQKAMRSRSFPLRPGRLKSG